VTHPDVRTVLETAREPWPARVHPDWLSRFPWLVQGTTVRRHCGDPFDLGLFADASPSRRVQKGWAKLREVVAVGRAVHAPQPHAAAVRVHAAGPPGLVVTDPCDGHVTGDPGVLLAVGLADCVPVFVVAPERRVVALLHAGWRGAAAGILERGLEVLAERFRVDPAEVVLHLGPSICGACYEVGPEVFRALGLPEPEAPTPMDLKGALAVRAEAAGVPMGEITRSGHCTRCGSDDLFFSHRGGDAGRHVAFLGVRGGAR